MNAETLLRDLQALLALIPPSDRRDQTAAQIDEELRRVLREGPDTPVDARLLVEALAQVPGLEASPVLLILVGKLSRYAWELLSAQTRGVLLSLMGAAPAPIVDEDREDGPLEAAARVLEELVESDAAAFNARVSAAAPRDVAGILTGTPLHPPGTRTRMPTLIDLVFALEEAQDEAKTRAAAQEARAARRAARERAGDVAHEDDEVLDLGRVLAMVPQEGTITFAELAEDADREEREARRIAVLHLVRSGRVTFTQEPFPDAPIVLSRRPSATGAAPEVA